MVLKYHISTSAITENFVVRIWEAASDGVGAHVYETTLVEKNGAGVPTPGAGHQVIETLTVNGLDKVVHIVRMYGAVSANLLHEYNVEPLTDTVNIQSPVRFKIGDGGPNTPAADQPVCITPELIGLTTNDFIIHRNNYGDLLPTLHYVFDTVTGSWELQGGDTFNANEEITVQILPTLYQSAVNDSVVGKWFSGFIDVSANTNYSATHLRKLIRFSGSPEYTFQLADTIPIGYVFCFQHFGSAGTPKVKFLNGTLLWGGAPKTSIDIPIYCEGAFVWDGTNWNVVYLVQSTWVNSAGAPTAGTILGVGRYGVGDLVSFDPDFTITHNLNISGDYMVQFTIESQTAAAFANNNKICGCWWHDVADKPNKFHVSLQQVDSVTNSVNITWMAVKM